MEEAKGVVKHVLLAKFKEGTAQDQIDQLIKDYANLVNLIEPMKSFQWGKNVSIENLHQGFTHIFESTFESTEGVAEYVAHPAHVEYANLFLANLEKVLVIDYKPTTKVSNNQNDTTDRLQTLSSLYNCRISCKALEFIFTITSSFKAADVCVPKPTESLIFKSCSASSKPPMASS
ncbi:Stress-response A/B barrel domain-containing protein HS1 [Citrus sinensis]|uniref:Stress-response A/B barrel domain-containing protein HS1 n=1 Tax=Citrus sinensis TaxID=2711 RepID=A0ACB8IA49_CITSI|nr:Stress-response A/B barrel domain-containing protein HS1 [Citrus sinensis]